MEPYASDLEFALFCGAAALGAVVALCGDLLLRARATGSFEQRVTIDSGTGQGPYRQGWFERVVSIDAPLALRVIVARGHPGARGARGLADAPR